MIDKKNYPVVKLGKSNNVESYDNSLLTQHIRILFHFQKNKTLSTIQAREELGILHPCGRIKELRAQGHKIITTWVYESDSNGVRHRIGLYVYIHGPKVV